MPTLFVYKSYRIDEKKGVKVFDKINNNKDSRKTKEENKVKKGRKNSYEEGCKAKGKKVMRRVKRKEKVTKERK